MKKIAILLSALFIIGTVFTGCASDKNKTTTTGDQTLTPTTDMSQKVSEKLTDMSETVSEALTDASEKMKADDTEKKDETTNPSDKND